MTLGQNGLFMKAQVAKKEYEQSEVQEDLSMLITQYTWDKASEKTDKSLGDYLKENGETSVNENSDGKTLEVEYKGYVFTVNKDSGEITDSSKGDDNDNPITPTIKPKVGDVVDYKPDTSSDYELSKEKSGYDNNQTIDSAYDPITWKVMEIDQNGNITKIFGVPNSSQSRVGLGNSVGYNNGVYILNDICKNRYGNAILGATARNLKIEDIELKMNDTGIAARNVNKAYNDLSIEYGTTKAFTGSNVQYPAIYVQEKYSGVGVSDVSDGTQIVVGSIDTTAQVKMNSNGKNGSDSMYDVLPEISETTGQTVTNLTCTQTYYYMSDLSSYFEDSNFYNMIFGTETYFWLSSRSIDCYSSNPYAIFGIRRVNSNRLSGSRLLESNGTSVSDNNRLAPVVSFSLGVKVKSGNGTTDEPYVIGK